MGTSCILTKSKGSVSRRVSTWFDVIGAGIVLPALDGCKGLSDGAEDSAPRSCKLTKGAPPALRSQLEHGKAWNQLKVGSVERYKRAAKIQRRGANQKVFECDAYAAGSLLTLNPAGKLSDFKCYWMHGDVTAQFLNEGAPALTVCIGLGPIDAMGQLDDGHD
jgi:hypothetical protein